MTRAHKRAVRKYASVCNELGICERCGQREVWLGVNEKVCEVCAEKGRQRCLKRARKQGARPDWRLCSLCRQPGHRLPRCPERGKERLSVDEFAAMRIEPTTYVGGR